MVGSGDEVAIDDIENQRRVPLVANDNGGGWSITSLLRRIHSIYCQFLKTPSSAADDGHGSEEVELTGTPHLAPASPHVSGEVSSVSVEDLSTITSSAPFSDQVNLNIKDEVKIQRAYISKIVKKKNFTALQEYGGIKSVAEAHGTDLHDGIPGDEKDIHDRCGAVVPTTQAPTPSFFKLLLQSFLDWTIVLLLVCAVLSTIFGIQQEGPSNGWLEGAVGMFAISILVVVPTMCKYFSVPHPKNAIPMEAEVCRRGLPLHVSPSDVVPGDIVCLASGSVIPAEGLFVSTGESLMLEDGMELTLVNDRNPFLVYGARVVNGNGRMLVTCVGMETTLGELMDQVRCNPNQYHLPAQLDKIITRLHHFTLLITIFMTLVLIIRSKVLKDNEYPGLQADQLKGKVTASRELINVIGIFFMKSSGQIGVLVTYLPILIVGLSEVPLSVALAIIYRTKTTLSRKANAQENLACLNMGSVSTVCIGGVRLTSDPVLQVDVSHDGDHQIIDTECVAGIDQHVRQAFYKGIDRACSTEHRLLLLPWAEDNLGIDNLDSKELITDEEARIKDSETGGMWLYRSGDATATLCMCSEYYDSKGTTKLMDEQKKRNFQETIRNMQFKYHKTIAFAHKKIDALMPEEEEEEEDNSLIWIGVIGLPKSYIETKKALRILQKARVDILPFPEDESMLVECETPIYGMGRPLDKLNTVQRLKDEGHIVAMVGARTNESPALKEAQVGIAMGKFSQMAGEVSDLIIPEGSLSHLITLIRNGRSIYYNIQKYIQVEFTMNISLIVTISVTTMFLGQCTLGVVQVVWANTLGRLCGLALLVELPTDEEQMEKPPVKQTESLISKAMWRNILLQASYQAIMLVSLQFKWEAIPGFTEKTMESIVFSSYVLCQVFNQFSSREPEKKNVFRGILQTPGLWVAVGLISVTMQVAFVEIAHKVAGNARLNLEQWGSCLLIAMVSLPIDLAGKCVSDVIMNIRLHGSNTGSTTRKSSAVSGSDSNRELLV